MNLEDKGSTNRVRDALVQAHPEMAGLVIARDQVVEKWCADHGKDKDALTFSDIIAIRALPEWMA